MIVSHLPAGLGASVFIVQHVSRVTPSRLHEVLSSCTELLVQRAVDREVIIPGRILVAPHDRHLIVERGRVRLEHSPRDPWSRPSINTLFRSAAAAYGGVVAGVTLSGTLADGVAGLWEIKKVGGVTIVRSPEEARLPDMPRGWSAPFTSRSRRRNPTPGVPRSDRLSPRATMASTPPREPPTSRRSTRRRTCVDRLG